jgi:hypothetical protein
MNHRSVRFVRLAHSAAVPRWTTTPPTSPAPWPCRTRAILATQRHDQLLEGQLEEAELCDLGQRLDTGSAPRTEIASEP